jgi:hypothetical protein
MVNILDLQGLSLADFVSDDGCTSSKSVIIIITNFRP